MATVGGNLLQRTRCYYFTDPTFPHCNKRDPGSGCDAIDGHNRIHAILGASPHCIATNPSDMAWRWSALDAVVHLRGRTANAAGAGRRVPPPAGRPPQDDTVIRPGELITAVDLPPSPFAAAFALPEGARPRQLCVRAGVGGGRRRPGRRHHPRPAHRAGRRGPQTLARARGGSSCCAARRCDRRGARQGRGGGRGRRPAVSCTTRSRSNWRSARSCGRCGSPRVRWEDGMTIIGAPINRTDGWAKVSGARAIRPSIRSPTGPCGPRHQHHSQRTRGSASTTARPARCPACCW
jgi:hypothetical protein